MGLSASRQAALARWLAEATGATEVRVERATKLGGGAIQENWALDLLCRGGRVGEKKGKE